MKEFDVIVVGAGILGIAHAYHCLQAGLKVAMIERNDHPRGASVRNFGQVVPSGMDHQWQRYGIESLRIYKSIQAATDITVREEGSIYLANTQEEVGLLEELSEINAQDAYPSQLLTREECLSRLSGLKGSYVKAGLYFPLEVNLDPRVAIRRIIQYCQQEWDLAYIPNTAILGMTKAGGRVLVEATSGQRYTADKAFLCSGTEFQLLFPNLFHESDITLVKLQMLETQPQKHRHIHGSILSGWTIRRYESFQACPSFAVVKAQEDKDAYHLQHGVHILFKQAADGAVIIGDSHEYASVAGRGNISFDADNELNCFILSQAQRIFDLQDWRIARTWQGYYCQSPSEPVFNRVIDDHIHLVTAIGGKGMTGSFGYAREHVQQVLSLKQV